MTELPSVEESYAVEVARKGIHLSSLAIPIIYSLIPRNVALVLLLSVTAVVVLSDGLRLVAAPVGRFYDRYLGFLLRRHERIDQGRRLNGATYVLLSASICALLFPKVVFLTAFTILIVSDSAAALVGRRYGRRPLWGGKTVEGSAAFLVSALVVVLVAPKAEYLVLEYVVGVLGAVVGVVVEACPLPVDDNLSIPLAIGAAMWVLYAVLLPGVPLVY